MDEWIEAAKRLPKENQIVEVRFSGVERAGVLFQGGRFWQVPGLIDLPVSHWRMPPKKGKVFDMDASDGIGARAQ